MSEQDHKIRREILRKLVLRLATEQIGTAMSFPSRFEMSNQDRPGTTRRVSENADLQLTNSSETLDQPFLFLGPD